MLAESDWRDTQRVPANWVEGLFFPFIFAALPNQTAELEFRDFRMAILWFLVLALALSRVDILLRPSDLTPGTPVKDWPFVNRYLLVAVIISYLVWLKLFGIYRYLIPIEMLAPLLIWIILGQLMSTPRAGVIMSLACFLVTLVTLRPLAWGRAPWADSYFSIASPHISNPDQTIVLMTGTEPASYVLPLIPYHVPFLRIDSNFIQPQHDSGLYGDLLRDRVIRHMGDFYVLFVSKEKSGSHAALQAYGLTLLENDCQHLEPRIGTKLVDEIQFCRVIRSE